MTPLSARLRAETSEAHQAAEDALLVKQMMSGDLGLADYSRMLINLHAIYQGLERQLEQHAGDASIQHIADVRLARTSAIEQDLQQLLGPRWNETVELEAATVAYLGRLDSIGNNQPVRLVAHAYVRYLGDLSGGQIISRAVRPMLGSVADKALQFYDFGSKTDVAELKTKFRDGLDRIECDPEAIIEEALLAFEGARDLFEQLALKIDSDLSAS